MFRFFKFLLRIKIEISMNLILHMYIIHMYRIFFITKNSELILSKIF